MLTKIDPISDRRILLTGAGGSIGSALARKIVSMGPSLLILLDLSEQSLFEVDASLSALGSTCACSRVLGDISDPALLQDICEYYRPEVIIHAAALKHVPLMEVNPIAAIQTNALGTNTLARIAATYGVGNSIMVSTDKAVNPRSIMGASKRIAELSVARWACQNSRMRSIRLGNVLGSQGSVVPTFKRQISIGGPVTVTHAEATRFFLTIESAVELILAALSLEGTEKVVIPDAGQPTRIVDLAFKMIRDSGSDPQSEIPVTFIGLRPGDKLSESFTTADESIEQTSDARLYRVNSRDVAPEEFDLRLEELTGHVRRRDLPLVMKTACELVPEYQPSETVFRLLRDSPAMQI